MLRMLLLYLFSDLHETEGIGIRREEPCVVQLHSELGTGKNTSTQQEPGGYNNDSLQVGKR